MSATVRFMRCRFVLHTVGEFVSPGLIECGVTVPFTVR